MNDDLDIQVHCPPAGAHVPEAERNIRVIKERVRITNSHIPFKICPNVMARMMVLNAVTQLNLVPAKGGVSPYYSPHVILKGQVLDWSKHCQFEFGTYVQGNQDNNPSNTNRPRTIDGIYLRPCWGRQGGHEILNLETGEVITRQYVTAIPITTTVIKAVEQLAEQQGVKSMKITGQNKVRILPADWVAGVNYDSEIEDGGDDDDYEYDESTADKEENSLPANKPITQEEVNNLVADKNLQNNNESNPNIENESTTEETGDNQPDCK